jgi:hypothetical protein
MLKAKKDKDENTLAKSIIDDIIAETEAGDFEETPKAKAGRLGGKATAAKLTPEKRSENARKAARNRWKNSQS